MSEWGDSFTDWDDVVAYCMTLPGVAMHSHYQALVPKVNGKAIIAPGREADSFCLLTSPEEKALLMATDPETFWETPHYANYPAVLIRYGRPVRPRIEAYIQRSWWDRATRDLRAAFGQRP